MPNRLGKFVSQNLHKCKVSYSDWSQQNSKLPVAKLLTSLELDMGLLQQIMCYFSFFCDMVLSWTRSHSFFLVLWVLKHQGFLCCLSQKHHTLVVDLGYDQLGGRLGGYQSMNTPWCLLGQFLEFITAILKNQRTGSTI